MKCQTNVNKKSYICVLTTFHAYVNLQTHEVIPFSCAIWWAYFKQYLEQNIELPEICWRYIYKLTSSPIHPAKMLRIYRGWQVLLFIMILLLNMILTQRIYIIVLKLPVGFGLFQHSIISGCVWLKLLLSAKSRRKSFCLSVLSLFFCTDTRYVIYEIYCVWKCMFYCFTTVLIHVLLLWDIV